MRLEKYPDDDDVTVIRIKCSACIDFGSCFGNMIYAPKKRSFCIRTPVRGPQPKQDRPSDTRTYLCASWHGSCEYLLSRIHIASRVAVIGCCSHTRQHALHSTFAACRIYFSLQFQWWRCCMCVAFSNRHASYLQSMNAERPILDGNLGNNSLNDYKAPTAK